MICRICGITSSEKRDWRPNCPKHGGDVCGTCCMHCEQHVAWSGIWKCAYVTEHKRRAQAVANAKAKEHAEILRISEAYHQDRKERAREYYIKQAKQRKR